jgi:hypothetical protein
MSSKEGLGPMTFSDSSPATLPNKMVSLSLLVAIGLRSLSGSTQILQTFGQKAELPLKIPSIRLLASHMVFLYAFYG